MKYLLLIPLFLAFVSCGSIDEDYGPPVFDVGSFMIETSHGSKIEVLEFDGNTIYLWHNGHGSDMRLFPATLFNTDIMKKRIQKWFRSFLGFPEFEDKVYNLLDRDPVEQVYIVGSHDPRTDRRSGRTTRLVDLYIQVLFEAGHVVVIDHAHSIRPAHRNIMEMLRRRLQTEHPRLGVKFQDGGPGTLVRLTDFGSNPFKNDHRF
jgi:hypothetical protein